MISGEYVMVAKCDNPACAVAGEIRSPAPNSGQARLNAIRAGWKIRKKKAICPACVKLGFRMRDFNYRKAKTVHVEEIVPGSKTGDSLPPDVGSDAAGV